MYHTPHLRPRTAQTASASGEYSLLVLADGARYKWESNIARRNGGVWLLEKRREKAAEAFSLTSCKRVGTRVSGLPSPAEIPDAHSSWLFGEAVVPDTRKHRGPGPRILLLTSS